MEHTKKPAKAADASVSHVQYADNHLVGVKSLRVLISKDGPGWFAQGLEIDYAAMGSSIEAVKKNFEDGLCATIHQHLRMIGKLDSLLQIAPQEDWDAFLKATPESIRQRFSTVQFHKIVTECREPDNEVRFPFESIQFIEREPVAA